MSNMYDRRKLQQELKKIKLNEKLSESQQSKDHSDSGNVNASLNSSKNLAANDVPGKKSYAGALSVKNPGDGSSLKNTSDTGPYSGRGDLTYPDDHFRSSVASSSKSDLSSGLEGSSSSAQSSDQSSHVPEQDDHQTVYASMESCIDEKSRAEDCFDYFTLALISPVTKALLGKRSGKTYRRHKLIDDWAIHGLWPTAREGGEELQDWCNRILLRYNERLLIGKETLVERLRKLWFALYNESDRTDESFWRYQFNKHGKCATRSVYVNDQLGYFQVTFELYDDINLKKTLADGGFVKGSYVKLTELYNIVKKKHGCYPYIGYWYDYVRFFRVLFLLIKCRKMDIRSDYKYFIRYGITFYM
ncbi:GSCOCG00004420001-RA-CDS [Cotesia congregata]|nr:GSCOCG00004420001-RA-CDS [Cotesia congregata]